MPKAVHSLIHDRRPARPAPRIERDWWPEPCGVPTHRFDTLVTARFPSLKRFCRARSLLKRYRTAARVPTSEPTSAADSRAQRANHFVPNCCGREKYKGRAKFDRFARLYENTTPHSGYRRAVQFLRGKLQSSSSVTTVDSFKVGK